MIVMMMKMNGDGRREQSDDSIKYIRFTLNLGAPLLIVTEFMENGSLDRYLKVE